MEIKTLSTGKIIGFSVLGVLIIVVLWVMTSYNSLVSLEENAKTSLADIEVQYQRRFDLIPNLVEVASGIAELEKSVFTNLAEARSRYTGAAPGSNERVAAMGQFDSAFARLLVVVENYPQLKSSESFVTLQQQIEGTENRVQVSRNGYNAAVNALNKKIRFFPSNLIAGVFGFSERDRFQAEASASAVPKVEFDFK